MNLATNPPHFPEWLERLITSFIDNARALEITGTIVIFVIVCFIFWNARKGSRKKTKFENSVV